MECKQRGRLLATFVVALVATLGLVLGLGSTAYAKVGKEYATLSVGDVLHVGDTINPTAMYRIPSSSTWLYSVDGPFTLVRCDIDKTNPGDERVVESDIGPYYSFKNGDGHYFINYGSDGGISGDYYNATETSDGIYVERLAEDAGTVQVTFAVHEPVQSVELDQAIATLEVGKAVTLKATVKPDDATDKSVTWRSSDEKVATVEDGVVTAVAPGEVTITATSADNPEASAECVVTVKAVPGPEPKPAEGQDMFRLYNTYSGEHFYTASGHEHDVLVGLGWQDEGVGWVAPAEGAPVYRLYNPYAGDHHYTLSAFERDMLTELGWVDEGVGWQSAGQDGVPVYRQYNPYATTGTHNYTTSEEEATCLVKLGWMAEGIGWYGL